MAEKNNQGCSMLHSNCPADEATERPNSSKSSKHKKNNTVRCRATTRSQSKKASKGRLTNEDILPRQAALSKGAQRSCKQKEGFGLQALRLRSVTTALVPKILSRQLSTNALAHWPSRKN